MPEDHVVGVFVINGSDLDASAMVSLQAQDDASILSIATGLAAGGKAGVGLAGSYNHIASSTHVEITNSEIEGHSIYADAIQQADIINIVIGGAGGGTVGVGVSVGVNVIENDTASIVSGGSVLTSNNALLAIRSYDQSEIIAIGGGVGFGGSGAGIGASVIYQEIDSDAKSLIDGSTVKAKGGTVLVEAQRSGDIFAVSIAGGGGGTVGAAGSAAVNKLTGETSAKITNGAEVSARNSVDVIANSDNNIFSIAGSVGVGGTVGVAGAVSVNMIDSMTSAQILGTNTNVNAYAYDASGYVINNGFRENGNWKKDAHQGVAVIAASKDSAKSISIGVGGGGTVGVAGSVNLNIMGGQTRAIVQGANINQTNGEIAGLSHRNDQDVKVMAVHSGLSYGGAGAAAAGTVGVGIAVDIHPYKHWTTALVEGAKVNAKDDIVVKAKGYTNVQPVAVSGAAAGVAVNGSFTVAVISDHTLAHVKNSKLDANDIYVDAYGYTRINTNAGGVSGGAVGIGITGMVTTFNGSTQALITNNSKLDAKNETSIIAKSKKDIDNIGLTAGVGSVGFGGTVNVLVLKDETAAKVLSGSIINEKSDSDAYNVSGLQTVKIKAIGDVVINSTVGGAGGGLGAGVGLAVDIISLRQGTSVNINNARVYAINNIDIDAISTRNLQIDTFAAAFSGSFSGSGAVAVLNAGGSLTGSMDEADGVDDMLGDLGAPNMFDDNSGVAGLSSMNSTVNSSVESGNPQSDLDSTSVTNFVSLISLSSNSKIDSRNGSITINAENRTHLEMNVNSASLGLVAAVGGAVGIADFDDRIAVKADSILSAGGNIIINAIDVTTDNTDSGAALTKPDDDTVGVAIETFAGGGSVGFALNVGYASYNNTSNIDVRVGHSAKVHSGGGLVTLAEGNYKTSVQNNALSIGLASVGAVDVYNKLDATATILFNDNSVFDIGSLNADSLLISELTGYGVSSSGGIVSGGGVGVEVSDQSGAFVLFDDNVDMNVDDDVHIEAKTDPKVSATALGSAIGGLTVGVTITDAKASTTVYIGSVHNSPSTPSKSGAHINDTIYAIANTMDGPNINADSITLLAHVNDRENAVSANSTSAAGGLVGGNGSIADALFESDVEIHFGNNTSLIATNGNIDIQANNHLNVTAEATGVTVGAIAGGATLVDATQTGYTDIIFGSSATINAGADNVIITALTDGKAEAETTAGSGGLLSISAAVAETHSKLNTDINIKNNATVIAKQIDIDAKNNVDFNSSANSINASVVGGSGSRVTNTNDNDVMISVGNGSTLEAGKHINLTAQNIVVKHNIANSNIDAGSGGAIDVAASVSETDIENDATINIGNDADLLAGIFNGDKRIDDINGNDGGDINLKILNKIDAFDDVDLDSGGAISVADIDVSINAERNNARINIGNDSYLKAGNNINLGSRADIDIEVEGTVDTWGLAGSGAGDVETKVVVDNELNIHNNVDLKAWGEIYLGAGNDGTASNDIDSKATIRIYNNTVIPFNTNPDADATIVQRNDISIGNDSTIRSVGDIFVTADNGSANAEGFYRAKNLYLEALNKIGEFFGADEGSLDSTGGNDSVSSKSMISINGGILEAGIFYHQKVYINEDGSIGDISESMGVKYQDNVALQVLTENRLAWLLTQVEEYKDTDSGASVAFQSEYDFLKTQVDQYAGKHADFISIDDIEVSSGNIDFIANNISASNGASITAHGDVKIEVINESEKFLTLNKLKIKDRVGGNIYYGGVTVTSAEQIKGNNADEKTVDVIIDSLATGTQTPKIIIENNNSNGDLPSELYINGLLQNLGGSINIDSYGTIRSVGVIDARDVSIRTSGSFVQSYTKGFVNFYGNPLHAENIEQQKSRSERLWSHNASAQRTLSASSRDESTGVRSLTPKSKGKNSLIAGNTVFIAAEKLNISGTIQSGTPEYDINFTDLADYLDALNNAYTNNPVGNGITDITARIFGSAQSNDEPIKDARVKIQFDAANDKIIVDDIRIQGGYISLTGDIYSTGSGNLIVTDGFGNININNPTGYSLELGKVDAGYGVEGKIRITDTSQLSATGNLIITEYTRVNGNISQSVKIGSANAVITDGVTKYQPTQNRWLTQVSGETTAYTRTKKKDTYYFWLKLFSKSSSTSSSYTTPITGATDPRVAGEFFTTGTIDGKYTTANYDYAYQYFEKKDTTTSKYLSNRYDDDRTLGIGHVYKYYEYKWNVSEFNYHYLNASKSVNIKFIGNEDRGFVNINSGGNVQLHNLVRAVGGTVTINSTGGNISSESNNASVIGSVINLHSSQDIVSNNAQAARGSFKAASINAATGALNIGTEGADTLLTLSSSGTINVDVIQGDILVNRIYSANGDINLNAAGNVLMKDGASGVIGRDITINANQGAVESFSGGDFKILAKGNVNVTAAGDINLAQVVGDLKVDSIKSVSGDVSIKVISGDLRDVNTSEQVDPLSDAETFWKNEGLTAGTANDQKRQSAIDAFENEKSAEYHDAWASADFNADNKNGTYVFKYTDEQKQALTDAGWKPETIQEQEQVKTDAYNNAFQISAAYNKDYKYVATTDEKASVTNGATWTVDQLKFSAPIGLFIENGDAGDRINTTGTIENANISGRNITLDVRGRIGNSSGYVDVLRGTALEDLTPDQRHALAGAERDDIEWINGSRDLRIHVREDVDIQATGDVDISARFGAYIGAESDINIESVNIGNNDLRFKIDGSITNNQVLDPTIPLIPTIIARNLIIEAAYGNIGTATNYIRTHLTGTLVARGTSGVYINEVDGSIKALEISGSQVYLTAKKSIYDALNSEATQATIAGSDIKLVTLSGKIGLTSNPLNIKQTGAGLITIIAEQYANLINNQNSLNFGTVTTGRTFTANAIGDITFNNLFTTGRKATVKSRTGSILFNEPANIHVKRFDLDMTAAQGITIFSDVVVDNGSFNASTGGDFVFRGDSMDIDDVFKVNAIGNSTMVGSIVTKDQVDIYVNGDLNATGVTISSLNDLIKIKVDGSMTLSGSTITADDYVKIDVTDDMTFSGTISTDKHLTITTGGNVSLSGEIHSDEHTTINTDGTFTFVDGAFTTGEDLKITAEADVTLADDTSSDQDIIIKSNSGRIDLTASLVDAGQNMRLTAAQDINITGDIDADNNLTANAGQNFVFTGDSLNSGKDVNITSGNSTTISGDLTADRHLDITADDAILIDGDTTNIDGDVTLNSGTDTKIDSDLSVQGDLDIVSQGKVTLAGTVDVDEDLDIDAKLNILINAETTDVDGDATLDSDADITVDSNLTVQDNLDITSDGKTTLAGTVDVENKIDITAGGDINLQGPSIKAGKNINLNTSQNATLDGLIETERAFKLVADEEIQLKGQGIESKGTIEITSNNKSITMQDSVTVDAGNSSIYLIAAQNIAISNLVTAGSSISTPPNDNPGNGDEGGNGDGGERDFPHADADLPVANTTVNITAHNGSVTDAGDTNLDIDASKAVVNITADKGIGSDNALETEIHTLNATVTGQGNINIYEEDELEIGNLKTVNGYAQIFAKDDLTINKADINGELYLRTNERLTLLESIKSADTFYAIAIKNINTDADGIRIDSPTAFIVSTQASIGSEDNPFTADATNDTQYEIYARDNVYITETVREFNANRVMANGKVVITVNDPLDNKININEIVASDVTLDTDYAKFSQLASFGQFYMPAPIGDASNYYTSSDTIVRMPSIDLDEIRYRLPREGAMLNVDNINVRGLFTLNVDNLIATINHIDPTPNTLYLDFTGNDGALMDNIDITIHSPTNVIFNRLYTTDGHVEAEVHNTVGVADGIAAHTLVLNRFNVKSRIDSKDRTRRNGVFHLWTFDGHFVQEMNHRGVMTNIYVLRYQPQYLVNEDYASENSLRRLFNKESEQYSKYSTVAQIFTANTGISFYITAPDFGNRLLVLQLPQNIEDDDFYALLNIDNTATNN